MATISAHHYIHQPLDHSDPVLTRLLNLRYDPTPVSRQERSAIPFIPTQVLRDFGLDPHNCCPMCHKGQTNTWMEVSINGERWRVCCAQVFALRQRVEASPEIAQKVSQMQVEVIDHDSHPIV